MRMSIKGIMLAAAVTLCGSAFASNDVDMPAEQGMIMASNDMVANQEGFYNNSESVVKTSADVEEGMEVPFVEGKGAPRPIAGFAWCLVTKPATYKQVATECMVRPETYYTKCVPAEYAMQEVKVMVSPAKKVAYCLPAKVRCKKMKVMVEEAQTCYSIIPAEYKMVEKEIEVQAASTTKMWIPAVYKTVEEKIMVKPPMRKCEEGECANTPIGGDNDAPALCVSSECTPAEYVCVKKEVLVKEGELVDNPCAGRKQTISVKTLVKPAEVKECVIPPKYAEIDVAEVVDGAEVEFKTIPAVYKSIKRLVLVKPESTVEVKVPAKYETKMNKVIASPEQMVWKLVKKSKFTAKTVSEAKIVSAPAIEGEAVELDAVEYESVPGAGSN